MKTVTVNASVRYDVLIEKGLLSHCGEKTAEVFSPQKSAAAIITDDNVSALYLKIHLLEVTDHFIDLNGGSPFF